MTIVASRRFWIIRIFFFYGAPAPRGSGSPIVEASRSHSYTPHPLGLLWTNDQLNAETCTRQHTTLSRDRHLWHRRDSNSHSQKANGRRPRGHQDRHLDLQNLINFLNKQLNKPYKLWLCRSHWPRGLRRKFVAARLLRMWVRIPPGSWMSVCRECCILSSTGLCDGLITRPEESYQLCSVAVYYLETSWTRRPWPTGGCCATRRNQ